jgi:hypothetical protein
MTADGGEIDLGSWFGGAIENVGRVLLLRFLGTVTGGAGSGSASGANISVNAAECGSAGVGRVNEFEIGASTFGTPLSVTNETNRSGFGPFSLSSSLPPVPLPVLLPLPFPPPPLPPPLRRPVL